MKLIAILEIKYNCRIILVSYMVNANVVTNFHMSFLIVKKYSMFLIRSSSKENIIILCQFFDKNSKETRIEKNLKHFLKLIVFR